MSVFNDHEYFDWLYTQAFNGYKWRSAMTTLHKIRFVWDPYIEHDSNRASDGIQLRRDYLFECGEGRETYDFDLDDVSFFEVYVGLARKMAHLLDKSLPSAMSYILRIGPFDPGMDAEEIVEVARQVMNRDYDYNGVGGLFPLYSANRDQRDVELIYQMNLHVLEYELG